MKKQWRMIIISGAVLLALAGVWLISALTGGEETVETTTAATVAAVYTTPADAVSQIAVSNESGEYTLVPQPATDDSGAAVISWQVEGLDGYGFAADRLDEVAAVALTLAATEEIAAAATDLAQFGLLEPQIVLAVTLKTGTRHVIKIGKELPSGSGHYAMLDDTGRICAIKSADSSSAAYGVLDLLDGDQVLGGIEATEVTRLTFERARDQFKTVIDSIVTVTTNEAGEETASTEYKLVEPLQVTGNNFALDTLFGEPIAVKASEFIEMDPQDLSSYGLDEPQYTYAFATKNGPLTLKVGKQSDSSHYYAISDAMPVVFTFPTSSLSTADTKLISLISRSVTLYSIYDVAQIEADLFGTRFVTGVILDDGKNVHDEGVVLTLDGQDARINNQSGTSLYVSFYYRIAGLMAAGVDTEANPVNTHDNRLIFHLEEDAENNIPALTKVIEFTPRDDYTYYVFIDDEYSGLYVDGEAAFTSEKSGSEGIIVAYRQMKYAIDHAVDGVFNTEEGYQQS